MQALLPFPASPPERPGELAHRLDSVEKDKQRYTIIQKAIIISFQGAIALFALQQGVFVPCDRFAQYNSEWLLAWKVFTRARMASGMQLLGLLLMSYLLIYEDKCQSRQGIKQPPQTH